MFGNIISIVDEFVKVENASHKVESSLVGMHIVFEKTHRVVCEILSITREEIECIMIGEFTDSGFLSGIIHKPNYDSKIRILNKDEAVMLLGNQRVDTPTDLYIGKSLIYDGFNVSANIDRFFSKKQRSISDNGIAFCMLYIVYFRDVKM